MDRSERARRMEELFAAASDLRGEAREKLLDEACAEDASLRAEVESLLAAAPGAESEAFRALKLAGGERPTQSRAAVSPEPGDAPAPGRASLARGRLLGRYVVLEVLGSGGMGTVYAAYDTRLDRRVALKLLSAEAPEAGSAGPVRARLLREAQAMAQLSHPNVVAVHDVGEAEGCVFLAMELVQGPTLRAWLAERPRAWREVVDIFVEAGRGLAAAHAAGLVHRDFKPSNVLVGREGRVRVTDFGLARPHRAAKQGAAASAPRVDETLAGEAALLNATLTRAGVVVGTPSYMAPEQLLGRALDARADLFAFCVALWEALHGEPPFVGEEPLERLQSALRGRLRPPPAASRAPARLHRLLVRGLQPAPEARFPSMDALLAELSFRPARSAALRLAVGAAVLLVLGSGAVAFTSWRRTTAQLCQGVERGLEGVWDAARQSSLEKAFLATGVPHARDTWQRVRDMLDADARAWARIRQDTCEATRLRGEQSEEVLSLRMACLDGHLLAVSALVGVLGEADRTVVENAVQATGALPSLRACADTAALLARARAPGLLGPEVEGLRAKLARARALGDVGRHPEGRKLAAQVRERAQALGDKALLAAAALSEGRLLVDAEAHAEAAAKLQEAVWLALAVRAEVTAAEAATWLAYLQTHLGRLEWVSLWRQHAQALLEASGGDDTLQALLIHSTGGERLSQGQYAQAAESFRQALEVLRRRHGPEHPLVEMMGNDLSVALFGAGRHAEAMDWMQRLLQSHERVFGPRHPVTSRALENQAFFVLNSQGDLKRASELIERACAILTETYGEESPEVVQALLMRGEVRLQSGRYLEALRDGETALRITGATAPGELPPVIINLRGMTTLALTRLGRLEEAAAGARRLVEALQSQLGAEHPETVNALLRRSEVEVALGRHAAALATRVQALRRIERRLPREDLFLLRARAQVASSQRALGKPAQALEEMRAVLQVLASTYPDTTLVTWLHVTSAEALLDLGHPAQAVAPLEQALEAMERNGGDPNRQARARFLLARALQASGADRPRARELAAQARRMYADAPHPDAAGLAELERWQMRFP